MSRTFDRVKKIINAEIKNNSKKKIDPKRRKLFIIYVASAILLGVCSFDILPCAILNIILAIVGAVVCIGIIIYINHMNQKEKINSANSDNYESDMSMIRGKLNEISITSMHAVDILIEEVRTELSRIQNSRNTLYRRIGIVFGAILWAPLCYMISSAAETIDFNVMEVTVPWAVFLGQMTLFFVLITFIFTYILEDFFWLEKRELVRIENYLHDIKFYFIEESNSYDNKK